MPTDENLAWYELTLEDYCDMDLEEWCSMALTSDPEAGWAPAAPSNTVTRLAAARSRSLGMSVVELMTSVGGFIDLEDDEDFV